MTKPNDITDPTTRRARSRPARSAQVAAVAVGWVVGGAAAGCASIQLVPAEPPLAAGWLSERAELDAGLPDAGGPAPRPRADQRRLASAQQPRRTVAPAPPFALQRPPRSASDRAAGSQSPAPWPHPSTSPSSTQGAPSATPAQPSTPAKAQSASAPRASPAADAHAAERVAAAQRLLDRVGNADQPLVDEILHAAGQGIAISTRVVYAAGLLAHLRDEGKEVGRDAVAPGDVAFFRDTLDLNGNRKPDDGVTFAALVERVEADRVVVIARRGGRVRRLALDPKRPTSVHDEHGQVVNTRLVQWPGQPAAWTTGQCLAAYARP